MSDYYSEHDVYEGRYTHHIVKVEHYTQELKDKIRIEAHLLFSNSLGGGYKI